MTVQSKHRTDQRTGATLPLRLRLAVVRSAVHLLVPVLILFLAAVGQSSAAHAAGNHHQNHAGQASSHHAMADVACCADLAQDKDSKACMAQCLEACGTCAPLPLSPAFPAKADRQPSPRRSVPLQGEIAAPHPRPPSIS